MKLIAFDPGRTTGVCIAEVDKNNFRVTSCFEMSWEARFEITETLISGMYFNARIPRVPDIVIAESFRLRQGRALEQAGSDFPSSQVIAIIQTYLFMYGEDEKHGPDSLILQEPSIQARVQILTKDLPLVTGSEHKKDAYKHARFYWAAHIKPHF